MEVAMLYEKKETSPALPNEVNNPTASGGPVTSTLPSPAVSQDPAGLKPTPEEIEAAAQSAAESVGPPGDLDKPAAQKASKGQPVLAVDMPEGLPDDPSADSAPGFRFQPRDWKNDTDWRLFFAPPEYRLAYGDSPAQPRRPANLSAEERTQSPLEQSESAPAPSFWDRTTNRDDWNYFRLNEGLAYDWNRSLEQTRRSGDWPHPGLEQRLDIAAKKGVIDPSVRRRYYTDLKMGYVFNRVFAYAQDLPFRDQPEFLSQVIEETVRNEPENNDRPYHRYRLGTWAFDQSVTLIRAYQKDPDGYLESKIDELTNDRFHTQSIVPLNTPEYFQYRIRVGDYLQRMCNSELLPKVESESILASSLFQVGKRKSSFPAMM
jgi:hypothetical protein